MRFVLIAFIVSVAPSALFAEAVESRAEMVSVTLFPQGAQVTRVVDVPTAGEILVPNLPDQTDAASLRVSAEGMAIGAVTLIDARQPPAGGGEPSEIAAARDKVQALQTVLDDKTDAVAALQAEVTAAQAEADFLKGASSQSTPAAALPDLARTVSQGVLEATKRAIAAEANVRRAEAALEPDRKALKQAQKELAALQHPATSHDTLSVEASGPGKLTVVTFVQDAGWTPSYNLRLDGAAGKLDIERFANVHQATGEDWSDVALTLSTARPSERTDATDLMPDLVQSGAEEHPASPAMYKTTADAIAMAAPVAEVAQAGFEGETVVYRYPAAVSIRDGVEALRLKLDALSAPVTQVAQAVPMFDSVAYRQIEGRNDGDEPFLPGPANLFVDGAMVGTTLVPLIAAGDKFAFGFGAIDGLKLSRIVPQASQGDRGILSKSNARVEVARITVDNLTPRDWPVRLLDRVPYSEQDSLKVTWKADPAPSATDWQDRRGVLSWVFDLPKGQKKEISLTTTISWPTGQVLQ